MIIDEDDQPRITDGSVRVWEPEGSKRPPQYVALPIPVGPTNVRLATGWAQSPDGRRMAISSEIAPLLLWNLALNRAEATFGNKYSLLPAFSPDSRLLASSEGRARIWEIGSRREANTLRIAGLNTWTVLQPAVRNTDRDLSRFFGGIPEKVPIR